MKANSAVSEIRVTFSLVPIPRSLTTITRGPRTAARSSSPVRAASSSILSDPSNASIATGRPSLSHDKPSRPASARACPSHGHSRTAPAGRCAPRSTSRKRGRAPAPSFRCRRASRCSTTCASRSSSQSIAAYQLIVHRACTPSSSPSVQASSCLVHASFEPPKRSRARRRNRARAVLPLRQGGRSRRRRAQSALTATPGGRRRLTARPAGPAHCGPPRIPR